MNFVVSLSIDVNITVNMYYGDFLADETGVVSSPRHHSFTALHSFK